MSLVFAAPFLWPQIAPEPKHVAPVVVQGRADDDPADGESFSTTESAPGLSGGRQTAAEVVQSSPGVTTKTLGGMHDFTTLSIRGGTSTQAGVYLDGVPLNTASIGTVDLSTLLLFDLAKVEVHRGFTPSALGVEGFTGALALESREPTALGAAAQASYGSFATRQAAVSVGAPLSERARPWFFSAAAYYAGKRGDFLYLDNDGTPLNLRDDRLAPRRNNDDNLANLRLALAHRFSSGPRLSLAVHVFGKEQGAPGPVSQVDQRARFGTVRPLIVAALEQWKLARAMSIDVRLSSLSEFLRTSRFAGDPASEAGREQDVRLQATWRWLPAEWLSLSAGALASSAAYAALRPPSPSDVGHEVRTRTLLGASLEGRAYFFGERLQVGLSSRFDGAFDRGVVSPGRYARAERQSIDKRVFWAQPTLTVSGEATHGLWLIAHLGARTRLPTFYELFGSEGRVRGNPTLAPEKQWAFDAGVRYALGARLKAELVYSEARAADLVVFVQQGQDLAQAQNVARAEIRTLESIIALKPLAWFGLTANATLQVAQNETPGVEAHQPLPGRPLFQGRAEAAFFVPGPVRARVTYEAQYLSQTYLDRVATNAAPARWPQNFRLFVQPYAGLPLFAAFDALNVFDQTTQPLPLAVLGGAEIRVPIVDFYGYPLPGRSFYFSLVYAFGDKAKVLGESLCNVSC